MYFLLRFNPFFVKSLVKTYTSLEERAPVKAFQSFLR